MCVALTPSSVRIRFLEKGIPDSFTWLTRCVDRHDPNDMTPCPCLLARLMLSLQCSLSALQHLLVPTATRQIAQEGQM